jgi:hypothetical protein
MMKLDLDFLVMYLDFQIQLSLVSLLRIEGDYERVVNGWSKRGEAPTHNLEGEAKQMTTIAERMRENLNQQGMFPEQVAAVMERVYAAPENAPMKNRWNDKPEDYPPAITALAWATVKRHALAYIDETCPQAWFRPLFTNEPVASDDSGTTA